MDCERFRRAWEPRTEEQGPQSLRQHVADCASCRAWMSAQMAVDRLLAHELPRALGKPVPPEVGERMRRQLTRDYAHPAESAEWPAGIPVPALSTFGRLVYAAASALTAAALLALVVRPHEYFH